MPRGDCERAVAEAALADGVELIPVGRSVRWLTQRGHLDLPNDLAEPRALLAQIFEVLGGDDASQASKRSAALPGDLIHVASRTLVEVDEVQHFTTFRRVTLDLYPRDQPTGFDLDQYRILCNQWSVKADRYRHTKSAVGFGPGGRQRQRAYNDALRDVVAPWMGYEIVRIDAVEGDGPLAYQRSRKRLISALDRPSRSIER